MSANGKYVLCVLFGLFTGIVMDMLAIAILMFVAVLTMGYGGDSVNTFFFPFGALVLRLVPPHSPSIGFLAGDNAMWWLGFLPMPIYGLVLGHAWTRKKFLWTAMAVGIVHLIVWISAAALGGYPSEPPHHMC